LPLPKVVPTAVRTVIGQMRPAQTHGQINDLLDDGKLGAITLCLIHALLDAGIKKRFLQTNKNVRATLKMNPL
jgi:hypothetical protein